MPLDFACFDENKLATVKGQKFTIKNPDNKPIKRFDCDGGVFPKNTQTKRCDFFFEVKESPIEKVFYVEFKKGKKAEDALNQIHSTAQYPDIKLRHKNAKKEGYAIVSGVRRPAARTQRQTGLAEFQRKYGFQIFIKVNQWTVTA